MSLHRRSLSSTAREALYDQARGNNRYPDCNICGLPVIPGQRWHQSHNPHLPHALGGELDGIAHERCNLEHNHKIDTPLVAKIKRMRRQHIGAYVPQSPMPGARTDRLKKKMNGQVVDRTTGLPWICNR